MENKRQKLKERMRQLTTSDCCVAFSGGVDSSLVLKLALDAAKEQGTRVIAVMFDTMLHPTGDKEIAKSVAGQLGAEFFVLSVNELEDERILDNPVNRCYLCKRMLFTTLKDFVAQQGITVILEGTNHDDLSQYRPGIKAVDELGIISPLREAGLTKEEVRTWAGELGIAVAQRPSTPCMATRLPYGTRLDIHLLEKIESGEEKLRNMGYRNVRMRVHGDIVRLEVDKESMGQVLAHANLIVETIKMLGFRYVTLDLEGFRSGSMDV